MKATFQMVWRQAFPVT